MISFKSNDRHINLWFINNVGNIFSCSDANQRFDSLTNLTQHWQIVIIEHLNVENKVYQTCIALMITLLNHLNEFENPIFVSFRIDLIRCAIFAPTINQCHFPLKHSELSTALIFKHKAIMKFLPLWRLHLLHFHIFQFKVGKSCFQ